MKVKRANLSLANNMLTRKKGISTTAEREGRDGRGGNLQELEEMRKRRMAFYSRVV